MKEFENLVDEAEEMFLCLPCAKAMEAGKWKTVKSITIGGHQKKKGTCDQCCCRRYGYKCKVEFNWEV